MSNNTNKSSQKQADIRRGLPQRRSFAFRLSLTNILILLFVTFLGYYLISSFFAPDKGAEITIDEFVSNIKENRYSQVNIEYDGKAVGFEKYLEKSNVDLNELQLSSLVSVYRETDLQIKTLDELVNDFSNTSSLQKIKDAFVGGRNGISELIFLDDSLIAKTTLSSDKDYLISDVTEEEFKTALRTKGVERGDLNVIWTYYRAAGEEVPNGDFRTKAREGEYSVIWEVDENVYAKEREANIERTYVVWKGFTNNFTQFLQDEGVNFSAGNVEILSVYNPPLSIDTLIMIGGILALVFAVSLLVKAMQGQGNSLMQFGQSKARLFWGKKPEVTFDDVAGVREAKEELREVVMFLKNPKKFTNLGARIPKGMLMVGPPGTGKTLLAKAIAGEANVPFFHTSGSEFEEMLVGAGASRVRDLFTKAKKAAPSLIFIDEVDAIARKRGTTVQTSHTEQTLNQILVEMDGFESNQNVIVIAATNRPDVLDPAILRPGRFDRRIVLGLPDIDGRREILAIHAKNKPLAKSVELEKVAKRTVGFSGADLENMLNEAAIIAAKDNRKEITFNDIEEAATKVVAGPEKKLNRTENELEMTAYHEAGHAIVARLTDKTDPVHRVTIVSRGMALGWTMQLPERDKYQQSKQELEATIMVLMGGRAAEELVFEDVTSGASNDIEKATSIARKMVKQYGMSSKLGLVKYGENNELQYLGYGYGEQRDYSDNTADEIDDEVKRIINESYEKAKQILKDNKKILDELVKLLLEKEVVEAEEFEQLFK